MLADRVIGELVKVCLPPQCIAISTCLVLFPFGINVYACLIVCCKQSSHVAILLFEIQVLKVTPIPVVFASFSGGPKGCTYKVLQVNRWEALTL